MILGSPGPTPIHLRNCSVDTLPQYIRAQCANPGDSGGMVTGFQVIGQPADFDQLAIGKLYAGHTLECQTSAIVEVEQNGVSVIPVLGETGIVNSSVEYSEVVGGCGRFAYSNKYRLVAIILLGLYLFITFYLYYRKYSRY